MTTHKQPRIIPNIIRILFVLTIIVLFAIGANVVLGNPDSPRLLNYQGKLTDDNGAVTGTVAIIFSIYDAGGSPLWSEPHDNVDVQDGFFNVILGSLTPIDDSVLRGRGHYCTCRRRTQQDIALLHLKTN
ncbi:hypothetical protein H8E77_25585 [bacterium]|nr:hypothetical protein [bacterium]